MATVIQHLPDELLAVALGYLAECDLKSARMTCARWSEIGAASLIKRVYFAPRKDVMDLFRNITSHPIFSRNITEVICDGRLYMSAYADQGRFRGQYPTLMEPLIHGMQWDHCPEIEDRVDDQGDIQFTGLSKIMYDLYNQLFEDQEDILSHGKDYKALCNGLQRMPNVSSITVLDKFEHEDRAPGKENPHLSYFERTWRAPYTEGWTERFDFFLEDFEEFPLITDGQKWDLRGINHLFSALKKHCSSIKSVCIGHDFSKAPQEVMDPSSIVVDYLKDIAGSLLDLSITTTSKAEDLSGLASVIAGATHLENLSLGTRLSFSEIGESNFNQTHLKSLYIGEMTCSGEEFISLVKGSRNTLRKLHLMGVILQGDTSWQLLASRCGILLQLHHIEFSGLHYGPDFHMLTLKETEDVGRQFMGWVDPQVLRMEPVEKLSQKVKIHVDPHRLEALQHHHAA